jgi:hypothetical protein
MRSFSRPARAERLINLDETICDKIERLLLQLIGAHAGEVNFIAFGDWHFPCVGMTMVDFAGVGETFFPLDLRKER